MSKYGDNIRTIARTKELAAQTSKALKIAESALKEAIQAQRAVALQSNTGSATVSTSGTSSVPAVPIVGPSGVASTSSYGNIGTGSFNLPAANTPSDSTLADYQASSMETAKGVDKGDQLANAVVQPMSGSEIVDQAKLGVSNAGWTAIASQMTAMGYTAAQITAAREQYLNKEPGVFEIGALMDGLVGPKILQAKDDMFGISQISEILKGVVGIDPTNSALSMMLRFFSRDLPWPSDADAAAGGQGNWGSPTDAPESAGWYSGFYWGVLIFPGATSDYYSTQAEMESACTSYVRNYYAATYSGLAHNGYHIAFTLPPTTTVGASMRFSGTHIATSTFYSNAIIHSVSVLKCTTDPHAVLCALTEAPPVTSWPITNSWVLTRLLGLFVPDVKDSEAPAAYRAGSTSAQIKSQSNGNTYTVAPGANGGLVMYDTNTPTTVLYYDKVGRLAGVVPYSALGHYAARTYLPNT